jgi:biopolymer transport protein ExbD
MLQLPASKARKRVGLTPMIDVVFLLLVFFMLASQFGIDRVIPLGAGGQGGEYSGPPRMVTLKPEGISLNGKPINLALLPTALNNLTNSFQDAIVLQPADDVPLQSLMDVAAALKIAGFTNLMVTE